MKRSRGKLFNDGELYRYSKELSLRIVIIQEILARISNAFGINPFWNLLLKRYDHLNVYRIFRG